MDINKYFPSFDDFCNQINAFNFKQEDLEFQKKMALKAGYKTWEEYLQFIYEINTRSFDLKEISKELSPDYSQTNRLSGSYTLLCNKHKNDSVIGQKKEIIKKVKSFPQQFQVRIGSIEEKIYRFFFVLLIEKQKHDTSGLDLVLAFYKDLKKQFEFINPSYAGIIQDKILYIESVLLTNTNSVLQKQITPNFYFPEKAYLLKPLHDELFALKFIEPNTDFEKTFEVKIKPSNIKPTRWLTDGPKLFYLLYRLNNNEEFFRELSIDKIANQLFCFEKQKSSKSIHDNFKKALPLFEDENYRIKKMSEINALLQKLPQ